MIGFVLACALVLIGCGTDSDPGYKCRAPESYVDPKTGDTEIGIPCTDRHGYIYFVEDRDGEHEHVDEEPVAAKPYG